MAKVVLYTFAIFKEPNQHEQNDGFHARNPFVYTSAENAKGFVDPSGNSWKRDHATRNSDRGTREVSPRFFPGENHRDTAATLSVWEDVESIYAFTYHGFHAEVLSNRDEWFVEGEWPAYVAWWTRDDVYPTRAEGAKRLEHLHDHGPTAYAFNFKAPFDADGNPLRMDRDKIQERSQIVESHMRRE